MRRATGPFDLAVRVAAGSPGRLLAAALERAVPWKDDRLAVLTYHRVAPLPDRPDLHPGLRSADPTSFRAQVSYLAEHANVVDLETVLATFDGSMRLPRRAILLTFDDGYADIADHAWPVLRELRLPAVMFVATGFPELQVPFWWDRLYAAIDSGRRPERLVTTVGEVQLDSAERRFQAFRALRARIKSLPHDEALATVDRIVLELDGPAVRGATLDWHALRRLANEGLTLAPHSRSHPILTTLDDQQLADELARPIEDLRREIGTAPPVIAYPSGMHDARVRAATRDAGYRLAFTTRRGAVVSHRTADPLALPRIGVGRRTTIALLRLQLAPAVDRFAVRTGHARGSGFPKQDAT